ncbi:MAG: hypothetical protein LBT37_08970 [Lactobacillaceae bacterium]|nr:hypothetical protein [Lactobacillaceae bacterium]
MQKNTFTKIGATLIIASALVGGSVKLITANNNANAETQQGTQLLVRPEMAVANNKAINKTTKSYINVPETALTTNQYQDSTKYDPALAQIGAVLSQSCYSNELDDDDKPGYTNQDLHILGYDDIQLYNFDLDSEGAYNSATNIAFTIAHKTVTIDGKKANTFIIVLRGTPSSKEWQGDFSYQLNSGDNGAKYWEKNIYDLGNEVHRTFTEYCMSHEETIRPETENKLFVTGHSRGGGTSECLGYLFDKDIQNNTGMMASHSEINANDDPISKKNVAVYAIAPTQAYHPTTDANTDDSEVKANEDGEYDNIQDVVNPMDFVPTNPLTKWGYQHIGHINNLFNPKTETEANYQKFMQTYEKIAHLGKNDSSQLYSLVAIKKELGFGTGTQFKTLKDRVSHDQNGMNDFSEAIHAVSPQLSDYDVPADLTFQTADNQTETESLSPQEFFHSYATAFIGEQPFSSPKLQSAVSGLMSNVAQTSPKALAYQSVLTHLPLTPNGPNIANHLCTTYIAWLFTNADK